MMQKDDYFKSIAEKLIEQLKSGTAPWQKPWDSSKSVGLPHNPISGTRYKGGNTIVLLSEAIDKGYSDQRWMTYQQATSAGGQVRKGEKGTVLRFYKFTEEVPEKDAKGWPILGEDGKPKMIEVKLKQPKTFSFVVFNASQIDNLKLETPTRNLEPLEINARAENLFKLSGAKISHGGDRAFYRGTTDEIRLPLMQDFKNESAYYSTALHELGHWTGHESRLNRDMKHPFGSAGYAKEELRAEIYSMMMGAEIGINHDPSQHASYVQSWIKVLEEDYREIFRAAADAEKMVGYVIGLEKKLEVATEVSAAQGLEEKPTEVAMPQLSKIYLNVPFEERKAVKDLGAKWDKDEKKWFISEAADKAKFAKWAVPEKAETLLTSPESTNIEIPKPIAVPQPSPSTASEKIYIAVPYGQHVEAKKLGAKWDKEAKSWFCPPGEEISKFSKWSDTKAPDVLQISPVEEFSEALKAAGLVIDGSPIMDGKLHRVSVEGGSPGNKDGAYIGHLDGHPAGFIQNFRSGERENWKSKGYSLNDKDRAALRATAAKTLEARKQEREEGWERVAESSKDELQFIGTPSSFLKHPYLEKKDVQIHDIRLDKSNNSLCIPAFDADGKVWSYQRIFEDGQKQFTPGGKMAGCMYITGAGVFPENSLKSVLASDRILISEGFATAATLSEATGKPVVVAFSSGNLLDVAKSLRAKAPSAEIVICGDDDRGTKEKTGVNPGREKAGAAAKAVSGMAIFPIFPSNDRQATDFNDLQKILGKDAVKDQVEALLSLSQKRVIAQNHPIIQRGDVSQEKQLAL